MKNSSCPLCEIRNFQERIIHEFEHGYWVLAPNQFYEGYSILILKQHFREWHEVPKNIAMSLEENLRHMSARIQEKFQANKMNLASLGNQVEHVHWHVIPRYLSDPNHLSAPDFTMPATLTPRMLQALKETLLAM